MRDWKYPIKQIKFQTKVPYEILLNIVEFRKISRFLRNFLFFHNLYFLQNLVNFEKKYFKNDNPIFSISKFPKPHKISEE